MPLAPGLIGFVDEESLYEVINKIGTVFSQENSQMASRMGTKLLDIAYL